jgi:hypothetical protein
MQHLIAVEGNGSFQCPSLPLFQTLWDSTSLKALKECPYKYFLSIICGLESKAPKDPLVFGIAFHRAMQIYHYKKAEGLSHDDALEAALDAGIQAYVDREGNLYYAKKKERGFYALLRAIVWHLDHFNDCGYKPDSAKTITLANGKPAAELSFRFKLFELDGIEIWLAGHFDHLVEYNGQYFVKDYKTAASLGETFFKQFDPNTQMSLYIVGGKVVLDKPVAGAIVDGIQCAVHFNRFQRGFIMKSQEALNEFIEDTKFWIEMAKLYATSGHYPKNEESCDKFGGCQFREACKTPPSLRENLFKSQFVQRVWDPSVSREE